MRRCADAGAAVDVDPHVSLVGERRLAGVDADPHAHGRLGQRRLRRDGREHGIASALEGTQERVALGVHLDAAVLGDGCADVLPVLGERLRVRRAERVEQARRSLDVGEQQRHRAARQPLHVSHGVQS